MKKLFILTTAICSSNFHLYGMGYEQQIKDLGVQATMGLFTTVGKLVIESDESCKAAVNFVESSANDKEIDPKYKQILINAGLIATDDEEFNEFNKQIIKVAREK